MYITEITTQTVYDREPHGLVVKDLEEASAAIVELGTMLGEDPADVASLAAEMVQAVTCGSGFSPLSEHLHGDDVLRRRYGFTALVAHSGRFWWHNQYPGPQRAPFMGLTLNVHHAKEGDGYVLVITDPPELDCGINHTESRLAAQLGQPRQLSHVRLQCNFGVDGRMVTFDLTAIARALLAMDGMSGDYLADAVGLAGELLRREYDDQSSGIFQATCQGHGLNWALGGFNLAGEDPATGRYSSQLGRTSGAELIALPDSGWKRKPPHLWMSVFRSGRANDQLLALASTVESALWANVY